MNSLSFKRISVRFESPKRFFVPVTEPEIFTVEAICIQPAPQKVVPFDEILPSVDSLLLTA